MQSQFTFYLTQLTAIWKFFFYFTHVNRNVHYNEDYPSHLDNSVSGTKLTHIYLSGMMVLTLEVLKLGDVDVYFSSTFKNKIAS